MNTTRSVLPKLVLSEEPLANLRYYFVSKRGKKCKNPITIANYITPNPLTCIDRVPYFHILNLYWCAPGAQLHLQVTGVTGEGGMC